MCRHFLPQDLMLAMLRLSQILFGCSHEFGWPRKDPAGNCYQQCLKCGAEYSFDWARMRRGAKIHHHALLRASNKPAPAKTASTWKPRERRISWQAEIQYRVFHDEQWLHGLVENISRSGLMFRSQVKFDRGTSLSMILEMPEQITGHEGSRVLATAEVARCIMSHHGPLVAVKIKEYRFLYAPLDEEQRSAAIQ